MMDIVKRLRDADAVDWPNATENMCDEAADTIEALCEALAQRPEPHEYLNGEQLKAIRPYIDALNNWNRAKRAALARVQS